MHRANKYRPRRSSSQVRPEQPSLSGRLEKALLGGHPEQPSLGGWAISKQLFDWLLCALPKGATILELGSGSGTRQLAQHFKMISVEHDRTYVGQHPSTYIYAPIVNGWYNALIIEGRLRSLRRSYDLLLIDGPPGGIGRLGILRHLSLFDLSKPIVLDDVHRQPERQLLDSLSQHARRDHRVYSDGEKSFGVI